MNSFRNRYLPWLEIHLATLCFGLAGLFGKFIQLPSHYIVFGRAFFAAVTLALIIKFTRRSLYLNSNRDFMILVISGALLSIHWFSFFHSIQLSTVAIGLLSFASFPIFVTVMEPLVFSEKLSVLDLVSAVMTFIGIAIVVPEFELGNNTTQGIVWGVVSGFTFAVLSLFNRRFIKRYSGVVISFYQNAFASLFLVPVIFFGGINMLRGSDWFYLIVLGVVFTALAHSLYVHSMKRLKAQQASIVISLEPVYGILFAALLLSELPEIKTLYGGVLIVFASLVSKIRKQEM